MPRSSLPAELPIELDEHQERSRSKREHHEPDTRPGHEAGHRNGAREAVPERCVTLESHRQRLERTLGRQRNQRVRACGYRTALGEQLAAAQLCPGASPSLRTWTTPP